MGKVLGEKRKESFFFNLMMKALKIVKPKDFHWILYAVCRDAVIISLIFTIITIVRLYIHANELTEEFVVSNLRLFTLGTSMLILLGIIPFYYIKMKKVIGFSKIDFANVQEINEQPSWTSDKFKTIKNMKILMGGLATTSVFGWMSMTMILNHYGEITSISFIFFALTFYSITANQLFSFIIFISLLIHNQYKYYFDQIPTHSLNSFRE